MHRSLLALLWMGCAANDPADPADLPEPCSDCALADEHNFSYSADVSVEVVEGLEFSGQTGIEWSGFTTDIHGHSRGDVFEVESTTLLAFLELTPDEVLAGFAQDNLPQAEIGLIAQCEGVEERCNLEDYALLDRPVDAQDYYEEGRGTWVVMLTSSAEAGAHAFVLAQPSKTGSETISITDQTSSLDAQVDFGSLTPLVLAAGTDITVDWSGLGRDGLGNDLTLQGLSRMLVARYPDPVSTLENQVFDLERVADQQWEADLSGRTSLHLGELQGETPFAGLDEDGTWLMAMWCESCTNPAPKFVTVMVPAP